MSTNRTFFFAFRGKFPGFVFFSRFAEFFQPRQNTSKLYSRIAEKPRIVAEHRVGTPCEPCAPCHHSGLYRIALGHLLGNRQAVAGRRKRRAQREVYLSSRQSRLIVIAEINTESLAIFMSWRALTRQNLRNGRLSRGRGTFSGTIQWTACLRAAGFDGSIRWTSDTNMIPGDNRIQRIYFALPYIYRDTRFFFNPANNDPKKIPRPTAPVPSDDGSRKPARPHVRKDTLLLRSMVS